MPSQITTLYNRFQRQVGEMSLAQRVFAVLGVAALVLGAFALSTFVSKPTMSPLFTNLSGEDAAAIVDQLTASGVQYELTAGGSTVMVPAEQLYDTRIAIAAAGLPANSDTGYALLDSMSMTSSEFQQQVTYQRALEGELASTIAAMEGVTTASVKLAIPQDTVFAEETDAPTASVFIETSPGASLGSGAVQAIVHLVSASIEGMDPANVAVIDANGVVLSTLGGDASTVMQAGQVADYESRIAANVQTMLDRVLGAGNAVVSVTAELNYDEQVTTSETFTSDPDTAPLSESVSTEAYDASGTSATGVLGPDNIAVPTATVEDGSGDYVKQSTVVNNAVNKVTEILETAPGTVRRQSVSVVVSDSVEGLDVAGLEEMVAAAAGIVEDRGDVVSVSAMTFDTTAAAQAEAALEEAAAVQKAENTQTLIVNVSKWAVLGIIVILVFILILRMTRRALDEERSTLSLEALEELEARTQGALEQRTQALLSAASQQATGELDAAPVADMESVTATVRQEIMQFAASQPAEVAEVLRGWLSSGRRS